MDGIKRRYVSCLHGLASTGVLTRFDNDAQTSSPYGWRRWAASLLAIYDSERMARLDLPWWNVAATREVEAFLASRPDSRVFEWGAGASTVWLARRANQVTSIEHDAEWLARFRRQTDRFANVSLLHRSFSDAAADAYVDAIDELDAQFDLIVIDGRARARCLEKAKARLAPQGIILFDDSGRARYRDSIAGSGMIETHHYGRSFCVPYPDHTSLLRHRG